MPYGGGRHSGTLNLSPHGHGVDENAHPSGLHEFKPSTVKHIVLCVVSYYYYTSIPIKGQGPQKSKEDA